MDSAGADNLAMVPWLAQNVPTPMNSIAVLLVLCVFLFGGMAFAISRQESGRAFNGASLSGGRDPLMSALPPKADMDQHGRDVRFVPKADICTAAK